MRSSDWSSDVCSADLLCLQFRDAFGPLEGAQRARLRLCVRGSTYFINTSTTYCTGLLRIPKRGVWRGFRPCFGFRSGVVRIPKKAPRPFFGFVRGVLLWITFVRPNALAGEALGQDLQPRRQGTRKSPRLN